MYKFRDWIIANNPDGIDWRKISTQRSPAAIYIISQNLDKVDWDILSVNTEAIHILEQNQDKVNWYYLAKNQRAFRLFKKIYEEEISIPPTKEEQEEYENELNQDIIEDIMSRMINDIVGDSDECDDEAIYGNERPTPEQFEKMHKSEDRIYWEYLSENTVSSEAMNLLVQNPDKINWRRLSGNCNPRAIQILRQNLDKINWASLSRNPSPEARSLIQLKPHFIDADDADDDDENSGTGDSDDTGDESVASSTGYTVYSYHTLEMPEELYFEYEAEPQIYPVEEDIEYLEKNPHEIDWWFFSQNPAAIDVIERNIDKVNWHTIWSNPAIFVYDYDAMRAARAALHEQIIARAFRPARVFEHLESGGDLDDL